MVITLTGFMGCGKSSVGRILAEKMGWDFTDLDRYIEHKKGISIPDIFEREGEDAFRALEAEAFRDNLIMSRIEGRDLVLALGGGTLGITTIRPMILEKTSCVYLKTSPATLRERLSGSEGRPLLKSGTIEDLLEKRSPLYEQAPYIVETDGRTPEEIAEAISGTLRQSR